MRSIQFFTEKSYPVKPDQSTKVYAVHVRDGHHYYVKESLDKCCAQMFCKKLSRSNISHTMQLCVSICDGKDFCTFNVH